MTLNLALFGVTGRMGRSVLKALANSREFTLSGATASAASAAAAGATVSADPALALHGARVAIDFSHANAVAGNLAACVSRGVPVVVAVTGLDDAARDELVRAAIKIPIVQAANTSLGLTVMRKMAALAAGALPAAYDIEISEAHHRMKRDAPSGTALALGESVAAARGTTLARSAEFSRHGDAALRTAGSIGFSVVRAGDIIGVHTVLFAGDDESLEITHRVSDRMCFARGALAAAHWLIGRPAGLYAMDDVLQKLA